MSASYTDPVIEYTKEKYKDIDMIVDVYTMHTTWASERMAKILGYTQDEITDMGIRKILDIDPAQAFKIAITKFTGETNETSLTTKTGNKITCKANIHSYLYENTPYVAVLNVELINSTTK
jgi:hypothetical protein